MASNSGDSWHVMGVIWFCLAIAAVAMVVAGINALSYTVGGILH